ncbi:MAG TPA: hypothetical protein VH105_23635 [Burkholderiales bacterium]|nr:hypothetical protein [Burkholderiales bacterium]
MKLASELMPVAWQTPGAVNEGHYDLRRGAIRIWKASAAGNDFGLCISVPEELFRYEFQEYDQKSHAKNREIGFQDGYVPRFVHIFYRESFFPKVWGAENERFRTVFRM